jgi:hypothetical protein
MVVTGFMVGNNYMNLANTPKKSRLQRHFVAGRAKVAPLLEALLLGKWVLVLL